MRRVVGDQIKALAELSAIVGKNAQTYDIVVPNGAAGPPVRNGGANGAPPADARAPEPRPAAEVTPRPPVAPPTTRPTASRTASPAPMRPPAPAPRRGAQPPLREPVKPAPVRPQPPRPMTAAPEQAPNDEGNGANGGWMSNLLRRASQEEEAAAANGAKPATNGRAAPPPKRQETLSTLSRDIARAIDHQAAIDLWQRHRRGEKNLFSRRLYTLQGQQTFDEVRRRYQRDQEFKAAVDRYISDFEKLLAEANRNGDDGAASNAFLISDTGKVYTLLAHAGGHFG
jgi:hypothetical protein